MLLKKRSGRKNTCASIPTADMKGQTNEQGNGDRSGTCGVRSSLAASKQGIYVTLYDMKPHKLSPAHKKAGFAELVCSNSLRSDQMANAVGLLKQEMRELDSIIIHAADCTRVPAGSALAVDRDGFSNFITDRISKCPMIEIKSQEMTEIPSDGYVIVATGPLTSQPLSDFIEGFFNGKKLYFYDAAAPIVTFDSIDMAAHFSLPGMGRETKPTISTALWMKRNIGNFIMP